MTVTFRKAGEAVATKVIRSANAGAKAAAGSVHPSTEVKPARAVNRAEAPRMIPAETSTKTTMMPWRGWVDRWLKDNLNESNYQLWRKTFYFIPDDPNNLQQAPMPSTRIPIGNDGETAAFREVSPGSQPPVQIPLMELDEDPYDSGYFKRDTRRRYIDPEFPHPDIEQLKLDMQDPNDPEVVDAKKKLAAGPPSSPGNKGRFATGPSDFDPSGLRAVMSATHQSMEAELDKHMPDHVSSYRLES